MFIVRPFGADSSIRSALGFMSLTSRWGALMFPGITVLTRDLNDFRAIHRVILKQKRAGKFDLNKFIQKENDDPIADELADMFGGSRGDYNKQVMSFWQRYGSMVRYFNLFSAEDELPVSRYRDIIFSPTIRLRNNEPNDLQCHDVRHVRIKNAAWYRSFSENTLSKAEYTDVSKLYASTKMRWWMTGLGSPARRRCSEHRRTSENSNSL